jgi:hypothetical protein
VLRWLPGQPPEHPTQEQPGRGGPLLAYDVGYRLVDVVITSATRR